VPVNQDPSANARPTKITKSAFVFLLLPLSKKLHLQHVLKSEFFCALKKMSEAHFPLRR
jgi:hypothetical protein